jgi:hypothetical protein
MGRIRSDLGITTRRFKTFSRQLWRISSVDQIVHRARMFRLSCRKPAQYLNRLFASCEVTLLWQCQQ